MNGLSGVTRVRAAAITGVVALCVAAALALPRSAAASTCVSQSIGVAALHGPVFYTDFQETPQITSGYAGYAITSPTTRSDLWVKLTGFTGGGVALGSTQPAAIPLGAVTSGAAIPSYFFLTSSIDETLTPQTHTVEVWAGNPALGTSTQLCTQSGGFDEVRDSLAANANKVQDIDSDGIVATISTSTPKLGGLVTVSVEGVTGTIGSGNPPDPDGLYLTPSALPGWPANAFRLVGIQLDTFSPNGSYTDLLKLSGIGSAGRDYRVDYTFRVVGTTAAATSLTPIQLITSGTQIKHTNLSSLAAIPAIQPVTSSATLAHTPSVGALPVGGGVVTYTLVVTGTPSMELDDLTVTPPAGSSLVSSNATIEGAPVSDPLSTGGTLVFPGPLTIPGDGTLTLTYDLVLSSTPGPQASSAVAHVGASVVDTTTPTSDNVPAVATVSVAGTPQTIAFPALPDTDVAAGTVPLGATATSGLAVAYASQTPLVCSVSGATVTLLTVGTCTIRASQAGDATYEPAANVDRSFVVTSTAGSLPQAIAFPAVPTTSLSATTVSLSATADSGLAVTYASQTPSICTVSGSTVTLGAVGTCTIRASQPGNGTYAAAVDVDRSFAVTASSGLGQSIAFTAVPDTALAAGTVGVVATATSGLPVTYASQTPLVCSVGGSTVTLLAAGTCTVRASQGGDGTYAAATPVDRSFAVTVPAPLPQAITFPAVPDTSIGAGTVAVTATADSGLPVSLTGLTPGVCTVSGSTVTLVAVGTCTIRASQPGNGTYAAAADVDRSFAVVSTGGRPQTITFPALPPVSSTAVTVALAATTDSGLPVVYVSLTPTTCSVSGAVVTVRATGTCTVRATQPGDRGFEAADPVDRSFPVTLPVGPAPQRIAFPRIEPVRRPVGTVSLGAVSDSGLRVAYSSLTPAVCTVSGTTVVVHATGTCVVRAVQPGDARYAAAAPVERSFGVVATARPAAAPRPAPKPVEKAPAAPAPAPPARLVLGAAAMRAPVCGHRTLDVLPAPGRRLTTVAYEGPGTLTWKPDGTITLDAPCDRAGVFHARATVVDADGRSGVLGVSLRVDGAVLDLDVRPWVMHTPYDAAIAVATARRDGEPLTDARIRLAWHDTRSRSILQPTDRKGTAELHLAYRMENNRAVLTVPITAELLSEDGTVIARTTREVHFVHPAWLSAPTVVPVRAPFPVRLVGLPGSRIAIAADGRTVGETVLDADGRGSVDVRLERAATLIATVNGRHSHRVRVDVIGR